MSIRTIRKVLRMGAPVYSDTSLHLVHVGTYEIHPLSNAYMYAGAYEPPEGRRRSVRLP